MNPKIYQKMWEGQPSPIPRSESVFAPPLPPITYLERITATVTHPRPLSVGDGSDIAQNALAGLLDGCFAGSDMLNLGCITNIANLGVLGVRKHPFCDATPQGANLVFRRLRQCVSHVLPVVHSRYRYSLRRRVFWRCFFLCLRSLRRP